MGKGIAFFLILGTANSLHAAISCWAALDEAARQNKNLSVYLTESILADEVSRIEPLLEGLPEQTVLSLIGFSRDESWDLRARQRAIGLVYTWSINHKIPTWLARDIAELALDHLMALDNRLLSRAAALWLLNFDSDVYREQVTLLAKRFENSEDSHERNAIGEIFRWFAANETQHGRALEVIEQLGKRESTLTLALHFVDAYRVPKDARVRETNRVADTLIRKLPGFLDDQFEEKRSFADLHELAQWAAKLRALKMEGPAQAWVWWADQILNEAKKTPLTGPDLFQFYVLISELDLRLTHRTIDLHSRLIETVARLLLKLADDASSIGFRNFLQSGSDADRSFCAFRLLRDVLMVVNNHPPLATRVLADPNVAEMIAQIASDTMHGSVGPVFGPVNVSFARQLLRD